MWEKVILLPPHAGLFEEEEPLFSLSCSIVGFKSFSSSVSKSSKTGSFEYVIFPPVGFAHLKVEIDQFSC